MKKEEIIFFGPEHYGFNGLFKTGFKDEKMASAACAYTHSCVKTVSGKVYSVLSRLLSNEDPQAVCLPEGEEVESISSGGLDDIFIVTTKGSCFHCNSQSPAAATCLFQGTGRSQVRMVTATADQYYLQMKDGTLQFFSVTLKPEHLVLPWSVSELSCGKEHVLLLTTTNLVLSFGVGSRGQLGHGDLTSCSKPQPVEALEGLEVISVKAGGWHSATITSSKDLYLWGWNESCQLGSPDGAKCKPLPTILTVRDPSALTPKQEEDEEGLLVNFTAVSCGSRHTVAIDSEGRAFGWGWNGHGQLGPQMLSDESSQVISRPTLIPTDHPVTQINCNGWTTLMRIKNSS